LRGGRRVVRSEVVTGDLPHGTVTFLFTDVEGSTRLLDELGAERYAEALAEHRGIVRDGLARHDGVEVDTQGDAFFCAFGSARSAVACAESVRDHLAATPIRVRMGLHTGEALVADRHYVGLDVHRAARIGACGHGGQIVLSPSTVALLEPGAFELTDLGEHRLKDLSAPVRLHQLGDEPFPPLRTLFRTNLPVPATPFLGRESELRDLLERASEPGVRVVTLTGPGGTGKTRLALQLAAELSGSFPDGTWWVPLASVRDGSFVSSALANVLDVEEEPGRSLTDSIAAALSGKRALVLLDNCEHLVDAAAGLVSTVAAACPDALLLATSREALTIGGEHVFPVEPLVDDDAVELFLVRSRSAGALLGEAERGVVAELCDRLDNLPLAVELAAARAAALPPAALLERLSSGLDVLKGPRDVEERQRTLRATIAWSHGLLEDAEQRLFRRLGVFVGGASLSAIEDVCEADLEDLLSLVAKSLVRQLPADEGEPRYWMLETIREFALEELEASGEADTVRDRHLAWYVASVPQPDSEELEALDGGLLSRLELDLANVRAAFGWSAESIDRRHASVVLASALFQRHLHRGRYEEAEDVALRALSLGPEPLDVVYFHDRLGVVLRLRERPREALDAYRTGERVLDEIADGDATWWKRWIDLKLDLAHFFYFENEQEAQGALLDELEPALSTHGSAAQRLDLMHARTQFRYRLERYALSEETEQLALEVYALDRESGTPWSSFTLGFCLLWRGKPDEAEEHFARGLEDGRRAGIALLEVRCLVYGSIARRRRNDVEGTRSLLLELDTQEELHGYRGLAAANRVWVALRDGDLDAATSHADQALVDWYEEGRGSPFEWTVRFPLLEVALARGDVEGALEQARVLLDESLQPLPDELAAVLAEAVESGSRPSLEKALELARPIGYA
jgi:predicted ATPase/class 3 adenylate cyclase